MTSAADRAAEPVFNPKKPLNSPAGGGGVSCLGVGVCVHVGNESECLHSAYFH